jgi:hypothetical protein
MVSVLSVVWCFPGVKRRKCLIGWKRQTYHQVGNVTECPGEGPDTTGRGRAIGPNRTNLACGGAGSLGPYPPSAISVTVVQNARRPISQVRGCVSGEYRSFVLFATCERIPPVPSVGYEKLPQDGGGGIISSVRTDRARATYGVRSGRAERGPCRSGAGGSGGLPPDPQAAPHAPDRRRGGNRDAVAVAVAAVAGWWR